VDEEATEQSSPIVYACEQVRYDFTSIAILKRLNSLVSSIFSKAYNFFRRKSLMCRKPGSFGQGLATLDTI
jgi:hypothetical protein